MRNMSLRTESKSQRQRRGQRQGQRRGQRRDVTPPPTPKRCVLETSLLSCVGKMGWGGGDRPVPRPRLAMAGTVKLNHGESAPAFSRTLQGLFLQLEPDRGSQPCRPCSSVSNLQALLLPAPLQPSRPRHRVKELRIGSPSNTYLYYRSGMTCRTKENEKHYFE